MKLPRMSSYVKKLVIKLSVVSLILALAVVGHKGYKYYINGTVKYKLPACFVENSGKYAVILEEAKEGKYYAKACLAPSLCFQIIDSLRVSNELLEIGHTQIDCKTGEKL